MNIKITSHHLEITDAISNIIKEKFEDVSRKDPLLQSVEVHISKESQKLKNLKIEATGKGSGSKVFITECGEDLYSMIDILSEKFERKIRKEKEKTNSKKGRSRPSDVLIEEEV